MASKRLPTGSRQKAPEFRSRPSKNWLSDFEFRGGRLRVLKTGATAKLGSSVFSEVAIWLVFFACLQVRVAWLRLKGHEGRTIGFEPDQPRPWYLVRSVAAWNGMRVVPPADAEIVMFFEDATWSERRPAPVAQQALNFACHDISKSRVAAVFQATFGYPLSIDPEAYIGDAVEKSEINSMHDGRVIRCPAERREGYVYQRVVDTSDRGFVTDLRTPCIGGVPALVWEKRRSARNVFSVHNKRVRLRRVEQMYSRAEVAAITRFCTAFGLDWGGLDILRDRNDGRIYIVDVNKTDVGPIIALMLWDKLISISWLARALERWSSL